MVETTVYIDALVEKIAYLEQQILNTIAEIF